jgi:hypothetical protein
MSLGRTLVRAARTARTLPRWCSLLWRSDEGLTVSYAGRASLAAAVDHLTWRREGRIVERAEHSPLELSALQPAAADVRLVDPLLSARLGQPPAGRLPVYLEARTPLASSLSAQLDRVSNKPLRRKMRQVARGPLKWRVTRDPREFHRFYRDLYAPFAASRFGDDASVVPERTLALKFARGGRLLLAESEHGEHGALLLPAPDDPRALWWTKVGHAQHESPATFVEVAVFEYCVSVGATRLDWGLCPPVALDGLYVHKRRLGAELLPMQGAPTVPLFLGPGAGERAFDRSPLVVDHEGRLELWSGGEDAEKMLHRCQGGGVEIGRVFACGGSREIPMAC